MLFPRWTIFLFPRWTRSSKSVLRVSCWLPRGQTCWSGQETFSSADVRTSAGRWWRGWRFGGGGLPKHPMATFQPLMIPILPMQVIITRKDNKGVFQYFPYFLCWEPKANITDPVVCPDCNIEDSWGFPVVEHEKRNCRTYCIILRIRSVFCFRIQSFQGFRILGFRV